MKRKTLELAFLTDGEERVESETTYSWSSPYVFCVHTTVAPARLAVSVHSTFTGHPELPTHSRHLLLGPAGQPARFRDGPDADEPHGGVQAPACVLEHCQQVLELLSEHGLPFRCEVADHGLTQLATR